MRAINVLLQWFGIVLIMVVAEGARAMEVIYDFARPDQMQDWSLGSPDQGVLERSPRYASPGTGSLHFAIPRWREGMSEWPAFNAHLDPVDFTPYDRLVVEVVNTAPAARRLSLMMADPDTPIREGFRVSSSVPALGQLRWEIDISETNPEQARRIDLARVSHLHFWMQAPTEDVSLYIDRIYLASSGEELPGLDPALGAQLVAMLGDSAGIKDGRRVLNRIEGWMGSATESDLRWLEVVKQEVEHRLEAAEAAIGRGSELSDGQREELFVDLDHLSRYSQRVDSLRQFRESYASALRDGSADNLAWNDVGVATVSSMARVIPRDVPLPDSVSADARLALQLAQNEKEGFQVVVLPFIDSLEEVSVSVGELGNEQGQVLPPEAVAVEPVGYVKTYLPQHPLGEFGQYVGWWPDPMLPFLEKVDVDRGDAQTFFVRLRTDKATAPGLYTGVVQVHAAGMPTPYTLDLEVEVYDFVLPARSPLPLAMTFVPEHNKRLAQAVEPELTDEQWDERWRTLKFTWANFLADHYISYDNIYATSPDWPDFEVLDHLEATGQLDRINLGRFGPVHADTSRGTDQLISEQLERIKKGYEKAKARGWLDRTYIYGFDERPKEMFPEMEAFVSRMRAELPGVKVMTTAGAYWDYWGEAEGIDIWCPILSNWDPERVERYMQEGREVWWYVCIASPPPYPNVFIDQPAIDTRVMMGAMTAKYRPDGFLYYMTNSFHVPGRPFNTNESYIDAGPFTTWNPKSFRESHGDGSMNYPGPGGEPLPNFRLENFRDGLEDYAYVLSLESRVKYLQSQDRLTSDQQRWLKQAEALLTVPQRVVESTNQYTKDPAEIYEYRRKLAEAIVAAPTEGNSTPASPADRE